MEMVRKNSDTIQTGITMQQHEARKISGTETAERNKAHILYPIYFSLSYTLFQMIQKRK